MILSEFSEINLFIYKPVANLPHHQHLYTFLLGSGVIIKESFVGQSVILTVNHRLHPGSRAVLTQTQSETLRYCVCLHIVCVRGYAYT